RKSLASVDLPDTDGFLVTAVESLSAGLAERLGVARAMSMEPVVLFYDEPTTGLDPTNASQIQDLILATHEKPGPEGQARTTLIITHDKDLLNRLRPRTVMLHKGRVFFDGPFEDFQASRSPVIRPYFDLMPVLHSRPVQ
ncbi:MAG: ABC transporter, partial [Rhodospirillales bacterium]